MKRFRIISLLFVFMLLVAVFSSSTFAKNKKAKGPRLRLSVSKVTLSKGETYVISLPNSVNAKWSSNQKSVATVRRNGINSAIIKAKKNGKATITAKFRGRTYKCKVKVTKSSSKYKTAKAASYYFNADGTFKNVPSVPIPSSIATGKTTEVPGFRERDVARNYITNAYQHDVLWGVTLDNAVTSVILVITEPLVYYNGQWCVPVWQSTGIRKDIDVRIAAYTASAKTGEFIDRGNDKFDNIRISNPDIVTIPTAVPSIIGIKRRNVDALLPNGTFFTVTLTFRGVDVTIPCVVDEAFSSYQATGPISGWHN